MRWEILSEGVRKSPPENVPKNLVFHVYKVNQFLPLLTDLTFLKRNGYFLRLRWKMTWCNMNYHINGLHLFWHILYYKVYEINVWFEKEEQVIFFIFPRIHSIREILSKLRFWDDVLILFSTHFSTLMLVAIVTAFRLLYSPAFSRCLLSY